MKKKIAMTSEEEKKFFSPEAIKARLSISHAMEDIFAEDQKEGESLKDNVFVNKETGELVVMGADGFLGFKLNGEWKSVTPSKMTIQELMDVFRITEDEEFSDKCSNEARAALE